MKLCDKRLEEIEDHKGVIRISKSKKDRQHNGQNKKDKQRSTKHTHKTKDRVTRIPLKTHSSFKESKSSNRLWLRNVMKLCDKRLK
jgi:hypothetical protein